MRVFLASILCSLLSSTIGYAETISEPRPVNRANWIGWGDYPAESRRAKETGVVVVELAVDELGRVDGCKVLAPSGFARLDEGTCKVFLERARFRPATRDGVAVRGTAMQRMIWSLPR